MTEEQIVDVVAEEVTEEEVVEDLPIENTSPPSYYDQYVDFKKQTYKYKQLKQQIQNNIKSQRGFGYTYKEINYDS